MSDNDRYENEGSGAGFMMGLLTGTVLGAGLGILLAPKEDDRTVPFGRRHAPEADPWP